MDQNLLFICIDCLRRDFLSESHSDTPFINSLLDRGTIYTELFSTATTTTPSVASILTGTYSEYNGVNSLRQCGLDPEVSTLAELFGDAGFETAAMATGPLVEETGIQRGFDHFWYRDKDELLTNDWHETAVENLESLSEPFALYLHLWEIHTPIDVPEQFDEPAYGDTPYARMLSALDRALESFVNEIPDDTLIVLHGDHGESLTSRTTATQTALKRLRDTARYERGIDTRRLERHINRFMDRFAPDFRDHYLEGGHGETVLDFMSNVPLVLVGSDVESATVDTQCRQIDVLPTLLDYFGIESSPSLIGESLLPADSIQDRPAYIRACGASLRGEANWQRGVRYDGYKYVEYPNRDWESELYHFESDPKELRLVDDKAKCDELIAYFPSQELRQVDDIDIHERLADLGYL